MRVLTFSQHSLLHKLLKYSDRYDISIQFWVDQTVVYISKGGVDLQSYGGDFEFAIKSSIAYLDRINKKRTKPTPHN